MRAMLPASLKYFCVAALLGMTACSPTHQGTLALPYFAPETVSPHAIAAPPAEHSKRWNAGINEILKRQKNPDPAEVAKAESEHHMRPEMIAQAAGPDLNRANYPKVYALIERVSATSKGTTDHVKNYWNMRRPFKADSRVKPLIKTYSNASYPSGHTTGAYIWARVFAKLLPECSGAFYARAEEMAQHRVLVGMHFPHDLDGGRQLAALVVKKMEKTPAYRRDFIAEKRELETFSTFHSSGCRQ